MMNKDSPFRRRIFGLGSRMRGNDGVGRGNDGVGRGNDGVGCGDDGTLKY